MIYTRKDADEELKGIKKQVIVFLAITFVITYVLDFTMGIKYGLISDSTANGFAGEWQYALALQMLFPAFSAIICLLIFKGKNLSVAAKIVFGYFGLFFLTAVICAFYNPAISIPSDNLSLAQSSQIQLFNILTLIFGLAGIIMIVVLNMKKEWRKQLEPLKLSFGHKGINFIIIPAAFILIFTVNFYLNGFFGFGIPAVASNIGMYFLILLAGLINGILLSLMFFFGEEFGWRVYLQDRVMVLYGRVKGVLLIGLIWGLWHAPIIAMGYNYPGYPILGVAVMILFTVVIGIIFSYAVMKTGSVWISVFLHLILNTLAPSAMMYISNPNDSVFSFGMGVYGIAFTAIFAILIFISRAWREREVY